MCSEKGQSRDDYNEKLNIFHVEFNEMTKEAIGLLCRK